jgi:asparagine synthase (glutamine-hydrolysing)
MCGIVGSLALALEADPDQNWVASATERITHRGPDDEGFYADPDVALGYKRLAIIDLSPGGHQPMQSADGRYWMVYNGEIYNYIELGQELMAQGVRLRSSSDSEVLLEAYARMGKDVVHRLRGMYAFAIWDTWTRELFCARDPFGIKPFYYRVDRGPAVVGQGTAADQGSMAEGARDQGAWDEGADGRNSSGRHAGPAPAPPPTEDSGPMDWFTPASQSARRQGRHAAGGADTPGSGLSGESAGYPESTGYPESAGYPGSTGYPESSGYQEGGATEGFTHPLGYDQDPQSAYPFAGPPGGAPSTGVAPTDAPWTGAAPAGGGSLWSPAAAEGGMHTGGPTEGWHSGGQREPSQQRWEQAGSHAPSPRPEAPPQEVDRILRFASERKALADPGELRELDGASLRRYLAFQYVPAPDTITPPIRVLPPGHALVARPDGTVDTYRFWRAGFQPAPVAHESTPRAILAVMRDSVAVHLRSDAPLGAFLSGGIDSAAICALAAEHRPDLLTFTVGFEREGYSEIDRAQETAAALRVRNIPYVISQDEFFHYLPQIIWHLDDPMADAAAVPLWFVAREASKHVKVVLSGEGSDELFGGYAIYHQPGVVRAGERLPDWGRVPIRRAASLIPAGVKGKGFLERTSTPLRDRYIGNAHVYGGGQIDMITRPGSASPWDITGPVYDQADEAGLDDTSTMQLVDINTWLPGDILVKADRMTMAHSLELRVPFLDREVMAVASRLAREEKIGSGTTKLALRTAMSEVLPQAAAERAKLGFPVPIGHWLQGEAYGFAEWLLREAQTEEWVDRQAALHMLAGFRDGDPEISWRHLWVLMVFSLWHQVFVERVYDPVALGWERPAGVAR